MEQIRVVRFRAAPKLVRLIEALCLDPSGKVLSTSDVLRLGVMALARERTGQSRTQGAPAVQASPAKPAPTPKPVAPSNQRTRPHLPWNFARCPKCAGPGGVRMTEYGPTHFWRRHKCKSCQNNFVSAQTYDGLTITLLDRMPGLHYAGHLPRGEGVTFDVPAEVTNPNIT